MSMVTDRPSAVIYEFPVTARMAATLQSRRFARDAEKAGAYADAAYGSGWYHDEAIRETDGGKRTS